MLIKTLIASALLAISLYSAETNAAVIFAHNCTLGLLPFGTTMNEASKKEEIITAYESKGFFVSVLKSPSEVSDVEFISDATVECTQTYFGVHAQTTVRIIESSTHKITAKSTSPVVSELFNCRIDLFNAINALPSCQIK
jgi:hypothetical protein